jgi:integrase
MAKRIKVRKTRRARGTGSIFPDKRRGGYVARVPIGKHANGKTRYREVRAATQTEVVAKMKLVAPPGSDITVGEWADRWLAGSRIRPATMASYKVAVEHRIKPAFGSVLLTALTTWDIKAAAAEWSRDLAPSTLANTLGQVSSCLQAAVLAGLIPRNPAALVRRPRTAAPKFDLFTPAELRVVIDTAATKREWYPFALCAAIGCRIGESLALRPDDYDPATGILSIQRTRTRTGTQIGPPKSERSLRDVRVPLIVRPLLEQGVPAYSYATAQVRWAALLRAAGLRYRNIHQLRHSIATHSLAAGVPLPNVARDLGDTVDTIVKTYLHMTPGADVCEAMDGLLNASQPAKLQISGL